MSSDTKKPTYRLFIVTHNMLSSIQKGIQAGHAAVEMVQRARFISTTKTHVEKIQRWAFYDKTMIVLQGGNSEKMKEWSEKFHSLSKRFNVPVVQFNEDQESADGLVTARAILLSADDVDTPVDETKMDEWMIALESLRNSRIAA